MTEVKLVQVPHFQYSNAQKAFGEIVKTFPVVLQNYSYFHHFLGCTPTSVNNPYLTPEAANKINVLLSPHAKAFVRVWAIQRMEGFPITETNDEAN